MDKEENFFDNYEKRFFFLHGKTDDEFCSPDLEVLGLEEVLHKQLKSAGYERILFFNGSQKLYFYDQLSKKLIRPGQDKESASSKQQSASGSRGTRSKMCAGPLGMKRMRKARQAVSGSSSGQATTGGNSGAQEDNTDEPLHMGRMTDLEMVGLMDHCMQDESVRTAVIYSDGLDFVNFTEQAAVRKMAGCLSTWGKLFSSNQNICIFIMPNIGMERIQQIFDRNQQWQFLGSQMFNKQTPSSLMTAVGSPRQDEVFNLFQYWRLKNELSTDWSALPQALVQITRDLCGQGLHLKTFNAKLRKQSDLLKTSLDNLSTRDEDRPALERLRQMHGVQNIQNWLERLFRLIKEVEADTGHSGSAQPDSNLNRLKPGSSSANAQRNNLHLVFKGNPGTGKTTIARLMGEIFRDAGLLELGQLVKASREDLVAGYVGQTALKTAEKISEAMGGILFVDEAYRLTEGGDNDFGQEAMETIMEAMENHKGEFSVITAGYPKQIEDFLYFNPGLRRRFGEKNILHIEDFRPPILQRIFEQVCAERGFFIQDTLSQALPDFFVNWYAERGPQNFGNAGDVINLIDEMNELRSERVSGRNLDEQAKKTLSTEDVPQRLKVHLEHRQPPTVEASLALLEDLIGLKQVKDWIRKTTHLVRMQQEQLNRGLNVPAPLPGHYVFTGRPGTGKTTVARIFGRIMNLLGLLGRSNVLEVGPADLVDKYVGGTEEKAEKIFKKALGGVLFIDEAHQLASGGEGSPGRTAIKRLVPFMLNNQDNLCVIVAGYPEEMESFLEEDPGLPSRFAETVHFEDFDQQELYEVFSSVLAQNQEVQGLGLEEEIKRLFAVWVVDKAKDFGNARDVNKLIKDMRAVRAERLAHCSLDTCTNEDMLTFLPEDIPEKERGRMGQKVENLEDILQNMQNLIGLNNVKDMVRTMINRIKVEKLRSQDVAIAPGHYLFTGNPGTGKTTVARLMGEMFRSMGILTKGHLNEAGRSDLVAGYSGQTALKTRQVLEESLDGVLFIDEAYQLVEDERDSFGKEALDALVAFMENHQDRLCIICAGYPGPMHKFVNENPGLPSRFSAEIPFEDYSAEDLLQIFQKMAESRNLTLEQGLDDELRQLFSRMLQNAGPTFGNGREARKLLDQMCSQQANRLATQVEQMPTDDKSFLYQLTREDLPKDNQITDPQVTNRETEPEKGYLAPGFESLATDILPGSYSGSLENAKALDLVEPALLFIINENQGEESFGSGFVINQDGLALTCEHVVRGAESLQARLRYNNQEYWTTCQVLKTVPGLDLALMRLEQNNLPSSVLAPLKRPPKKGQAVGLLGYPLGKHLSQDANYTEGNITSIQSDEHGELVQCSALAYPGNSGGPVFCRQSGEVLGLLLGALNMEEAKGINFFRPVRYVWEHFFAVRCGNYSAKGDR